LNEYNSVHWHNGHISGAGFFKSAINIWRNFSKR